MRWSSSNAAVASVSVGGLVSGITSQTAPVTITATMDGITGSVQVTVTPAILQSISVSPATVSLPKGGFSEQLSATGRFDDGSSRNITAEVSWSSTATAVATVGNDFSSKGLVTSVAPGTSSVTATYGSVSSSAVAVTVEDSTLDSLGVDATADGTADADDSKSLGRTLNYAAIGTFSDGKTRNVTESVNWLSSNGSVATVSNATGSKGRVITQGVGTAVITVAKSGADAGTLTLTVTEAGLASLQVEAGAAQLAGGFKAPFKAIGTFTDGSTDDVTEQVTWTTSQPQVALPSNTAGTRGVVSAGSAGTAVITATDPDNGGVTANAGIQVTDATLASIEVTPESVTITQGSTRQFVAVGTFSDGQTLDITRYGQVVWDISDANVASIDANGLASGDAQGGPVAVTATNAAQGVTGAASLTVSGVALTELRILPLDYAKSCVVAYPGTGNAEPVPTTFGRRFRACAKYADGFITEVTSLVQWGTQAADAVGIGTQGAVAGRAVALGHPGEQGVIEAVFSDGGVTKAATHTVTVITNVLSSGTLAINCPTGCKTVNNPGDILQYQVTGSYGGITADVTESATWKATNDLFASNPNEDTAVSISNTDGSRGRATVQEVVFPGPSSADNGNEPATYVDIEAAVSGQKATTTVIRNDSPL